MHFPCLTPSHSWMEHRLILHKSFPVHGPTNCHPELHSAILPFKLKWLFGTGALRLSVKDLTVYLTD